MLPKDSTLKMKFFPTQEALPIMRNFLSLLVNPLTSNTISGTTEVSNTSGNKSSTTQFTTKTIIWKRFSTWWQWWKQRVTSSRFTRRSLSGMMTSTLSGMKTRGTTIKTLLDLSSIRFILSSTPCRRGFSLYRCIRRTTLDSSCLGSTESLLIRRCWQG